MKFGEEAGSQRVASVFLLCDVSTYLIIISSRCFSVITPRLVKATSVKSIFDSKYGSRYFNLIGTGT